MTTTPDDDLIERVARAICKSRSCHGIECCEWPAQGGRRHQCAVARGGYDDAARDAVAAMRKPTPEMVARLVTRTGLDAYFAEGAYISAIDAALNPAPAKPDGDA